MSVIQDKQVIRKKILAQRDLLSVELRQQYSQVIARQLCDMPLYRQARVVLGYMNFASEFASEQWVQQALQDGKTVLLPRVNPVTQQLDLYEVTELVWQLETGSWGIREPAIARCNPMMDLNAVELVLLPGVAFTRSGARLGYGGGFYDKLLARMPHRPALIAGAFALQVVEDLPQEATDYPIDWLVTELEVLRCQ